MKRIEIRKRMLNSMNIEIFIQIFFHYLITVILLFFFLLFEIEFLFYYFSRVFFWRGRKWPVYWQAEKSTKWIFFEYFIRYCFCHFSHFFSFNMMMMIMISQIWHFQYSCCCCCCWTTCCFDFVFYYHN